MPGPDDTGSGWRPGVRLCLDWGKARVGVAACDPEGLLAYPVETIPNDAHVIERVAQLVDEHRPIELVLGLPTDLRGKVGPAARAMFEVAATLVGKVPVPVRLVDERLTTALAGRGLTAAGQSGRGRRAVIDQAAAVAILQQALDMERRTGLPAGRLATSDKEET
ncbi:MAG: Holliday junction resolvase RuvX [Propionibacteriaceae bacterium]|nr:Holliday junction resolvase RuvX [Propionibacteriaceae bacterium]